MSTEERRAPGATRIPFDALVEVGGALGPTFEAQAINVSGDGIQLRTAYLPEPGQPLTCRFDAGPDHSVLAAGEVVWAQGADRGGEFGVRFTDVDAESVDALKRVCGLMANMPAREVQAGSKVRLHIDGLAAPMRAKIKDAHKAAVTVGSDLGFLQVGRQVELEDTEHGGKRPASIDRVDIALDPASQVPQLVVTLRYSDVEVDTRAAEGRPAEVPAARARTEAAAPSRSRVDDLEAMEQASAQMKGFFARNVSRIAPKMKELAERARDTVAILGKRQSERFHESASPRRTTAPAPSGLHASPRRVLRGQSSAASIESPAPPLPFAVTKRRAAVAGGVMIAAILGALALKKVHHEAPHDATLAAASASAVAASPASSAAEAPVAAPLPAAQPAALPPAPAAPVAENEDTESAQAHKKHVHVAPFANGPVHHGNILRLKMDGVIESLEGAQQPTGFTVKVPGHKSLEAAAPLASRDSRIQAIKVSNDSAGAELSVAFKDGVPNYRVSAKGDTLVIALAPPEAVTDTVAKKDETGASRAKHKHAHDVREKKKSEEEL
jgi:hypothetical protein